VFDAPYFDHDAFTHHAEHVVDAPAWDYEERKQGQRCNTKDNSKCIRD